MEFDWKFWFGVAQLGFSAIITIIAFVMSKVFVKKEPFQELEKRVQTIEQTYVPKTRFDELEKRMVKVETATNELPGLVQDLNDKVIRMEATAQHFDETIKRIEHPLKLIVEAAMRSK